MFEIRFWGVRGSIAAAGDHTATVGGNTSCVEVWCGDELLILDAGTGLRPLGASLMKRVAPGMVRAHLLLSHYHWDHIQGFPFFTPAYLPGNRVTLYGAADPRAAVEAQMSPPHFPVRLESMRAELAFRAALPEHHFFIGDARVTAAHARHPDGCLAYRVSLGGRSVVYATDTEHDGTGGALDERLLRLAEGADVLIYDAQYTPVEYAFRRGWGHSTAEEGARLARAAGVGQLVLFHHDPAHDDAEIARIEASCRAHFPSTVAAREGLTIALDPTTPARRRLPTPPPDRIAAPPRVTTPR